MKDCEEALLASGAIRGVGDGIFIVESINHDTRSHSVLG